MSMTKSSRRRTAAILAIALVAVLSTGGTLAYISFGANSGANTFGDASSVGVSVLLTEQGWDNTQVVYDSGKGAYRMAATEYTLFGASARDAQTNAVTDQNAPQEVDPRRATTANVITGTKSGGGNWSDKANRAVACNVLYFSGYKEGTTTKNYTPVTTAFESVGDYLVKESEEDTDDGKITSPSAAEGKTKVSDLGIVQSLRFTGGTYAKKDPQVVNTGLGAESVSSAYVAIRVTFKVGANTAGAAVARNILTGVGFTTADSAQSTGGFTIDDDWVDDDDNGKDANGGAYYFYYRYKLAPSTSSVATRTSALFEGMYITTNAAGENWSSGTVTAGNFLSYLHSPNGLNGSLSVAVDAAAVQAEGLSAPTGEADDETTQALKGLFSS